MADSDARFKEGTMFLRAPDSPSLLAESGPAWIIEGSCLPGLDGSGIVFIAVLNSVTGTDGTITVGGT